MYSLIILYALLINKECSILVIEHIYIYIYIYIYYTGNRSEFKSH